VGLRPVVRDRVSPHDGAGTGIPGSNVVAIPSRRGATVEAVAPEASSGRDVEIMAIVDALFERDAFAGVTERLRGERLTMA
jgi:hypothetical protein